jgi:trans-aconitate methyltransferase
MSQTANKEWNAEVYHRVSTPQQSWGKQVLARLPLRGDEMVLDAGCGSGILTADLLERLPNGNAIALDYSANMLEQAKAFLEPRFSGRVTYIEADLGRLDPAEAPGPVDAIFSTATFHWVLDHDRLFATLAALLKPGGRLVAQCGGGPNIKRPLDRAKALMTQEPFAPFFSGWTIPIYFAGAEITASRLNASGFTNIKTEIVEAPTNLGTAHAYREFLTNVVFHFFLDQLPNPDLRADFIDRLVDAGAGDDPPFSIDYWRLNIDATKQA